MKRKFFPHSATWLLYLSFILVLIALAITAFVIVLVRQNFTILTITIISIAILFLLYELYVFITSYIISIDSTSISSRGDKFPKIEKVQYQCIVNINEINDIKIIASEKNSINKPIAIGWTASAFKKKYLEFTMKDNRKERICINHYTKNQVIRILQSIQMLLSSSGNNTINIDHIMKNWYTYGNYPKEK